MDFLGIFRVEHVDKVNHDNTADIPEPELTDNFPGSFEVGFQRIIFLLLLGCIAPAVHVDDNHCLGMLYNDISPGFQPYFARKNRLHIFGDAVSFKKRKFTLIKGDIFFHLGRSPLNIVQCLLVNTR